MDSFAQRSVWPRPGSSPAGIHDPTPRLFDWEAIKVDGRLHLFAYQRRPDATPGLNDILLSTGAQLRLAD